MADQRRTRFETVAALVAEPVLRYAMRRTDRDTAHDVLNETLLVAWRRLDDIPDGGELPWLYGVARNCLANAARSQRRQRSLLARIALLDRPRDVPAPDLDVPDPALAEALARLGEMDREVLRLWAWEDLAPHEIAAALGISSNAASIRLHRAKRRLAGLLAVSGPSPPRPDPRRTARPEQTSRELNRSGKDALGAGQEAIDREEPR